MTDLAVASCPSCGAADGGEDTCESCGTRLRALETVVAPQLPVSPFAKRAGLFALLTVPVNVLSNLLGKFFNDEDLATTDTAYAVASVAYLVLFVAARLLVVAFVVYSLYNARKAFGDLRTGEFSGRGRTMVAVVWDVISLALVAYSLIALAVQMAIAVGSS